MLCEAAPLIPWILNQLIVLPSLRIKVAVEAGIIEQAEELVLSAILLCLRPCEAHKAKAHLRSYL